ncbi:MAG: glycosyltransferase family 9 protein [Proteobacteria bacterium]|nr:glycosyltransferase family 9 protein [Pseudomonadota bacterium]MBW3616248.1 glycosyltransferase family 9 protein [Pseudomonadota bacterium]
MSAKPFPILFITSTRIGDAVLSSGLLARLHAEIPHARFTIAAGVLAAPLFRDTPNLEALIPVEKKPGGLHWVDLWKRVRGTKWGLVLDLRGSGLAGTLWAKMRIVRRSPDEDEPVVHKVEELARLLKLDGEAPPAPYLFLSEETQREADAHLHEHGWRGEPILAVSPAANWVGKTWPAERFSILTQRLLGRDGPLPDGRLLLLGGPDDRRTTEAVRREVSRKRVIDATGEVDLLIAYAMLKRARIFVGNDSGLMHLAAAAGTPTLGLFGPSDDRRYAPWGPHARALRGPRNFESYKLVDPQLNQSLSHMSDLAVERVYKAVLELLAETPEADGSPVAAEPQDSSCHDEGGSSAEGMEGADEPPSSERESAVG